MIDSFIKDLLSMGYRSLDKNIYAKPIGFNLLIFELNEKRWTNWFTGSDGKKHIYDSEVFEEEKFSNFLNFIKNEEAQATYSTFHYLSNYEFLTLKQKLTEYGL